MIIHEMQQGSPEWHQVRAKKITGSVAKELFVKGTTDPSGLGVGAISTAKEIAFEIMNDGLMPSNNFKNDSMRRGNEFEAIARRKYELIKFVKVRVVGFVESDCGTYGCSPDFLVDPDGGGEIKCFTSPDLHYDLIMNLPSKHIDLNQIKWNMFVCERKWWDFVSYYPEHKSMPLVIRRYYYDEEYARLCRLKIPVFNNYVKEQIEKIKQQQLILMN